jgi:hypothetical protein
MDMKGNIFLKHMASIAAAICKSQPPKARGTRNSDLAHPANTVT